MTSADAGLAGALDRQVPQSEFADLIEASPARVSQLVSDGALTRGDTALGWLRAYTARLQAQVVARTGGEDAEADPILEGALLNRSRREAQEIRNAQALAAYAPRDLLEEVLRASLVAAAERLGRIPDELAQTSPLVPPAALQAIARQVESAQGELLRASRAGLGSALAVADPDEPD